MVFGCENEGYILTCIKHAIKDLCKIGDAPPILDAFWFGKLASPIKIWPEAPAYKPWFLVVKMKVIYWHV